MKAPDKIYIDDLAVVNDCSTKISLKQLPYFSEYIRKDALLEWAKDGLKTTEKLKGNSSVFSGENIVFKCLIDKLNSM